MNEEWGARTFNLVDPFSNTIFASDRSHGGSISRERRGANVS